MDDITFSWIDEENRGQYTIEVSDKEDFSVIYFLRDTRNCFCRWDSFPLKKESMYYWRVRSGLSKWSYGTFCTDSGR